MSDNDPKERDLPEEQPSITTQSDNGEPEKSFGKFPGNLIEPDDGKDDKPADDTPAERPTLPRPGDQPTITTLSAEPEKSFGGPRLG